MRQTGAPDSIGGVALGQKRKDRASEAKQVVKLAGHPAVAAGRLRQNEQAHVAARLKRQRLGFGEVAVFRQAGGQAELAGQLTELGVARNMQLKIKRGREPAKQPKQRIGAVARVKGSRVAEPQRALGWRIGQLLKISLGVAIWNADGLALGLREALNHFSEMTRRVENDAARALIDGSLEPAVGFSVKRAQRLKTAIVGPGIAKVGHPGQLKALGQGHGCQKAAKGRRARVDERDVARLEALACALKGGGHPR